MASKFKDGDKVSSRVKKMKWFEAFFHIFNLRWNSVDNFRIDKYLMFVRHQFNALLAFLKEEAYDKKLMAWYYKLIFNVYMKSQKADNTAVGIPLQISDVLVEEFNKVDADASLEVIAGVLEPVLDTLG